MFIGAKSSLAAFWIITKFGIRMLKLTPNSIIGTHFVVVKIMAVSNLKICVYIHVLF